MCGIAGYNVSREFAQLYITPEDQGRLLRESWLWNVHRGTDAAGYFAVGLEDNKVQVFKRGKSAPTLLKNGVSNPRPAAVFGAHTRAATKGDAADNTNNHPVYFKGVWTTHNGSIKNDDLIKKTVENLNIRIPEVDSAAISIVLSKVENPRDVDEVATQLSRLTGGYAIHSIFKSHPGLSVLAKVGSPLILAEGEEAIFYGSEFESVWHMIHYLGLDPNDNKRWDFRSLDSDHLILVENGTPIGWGKIPLTYNNAQSWSINRADYEIVRYLPEEKDRERLVVYSTDLKTDFCHTAGKEGRNLLDAKPERRKLVYLRDQVEDSKVYPRQNDSSIFSVLSEADKIYEDSVNKQIHAFFGPIEIIMTSGRTVCDVYNHDLFPDVEDRWGIENKVKIDSDKKFKTIDHSNIEFSDFYVRHTTKVKDEIERVEEYKYVTFQRQMRERAEKAAEEEARRAELKLRNQNKKDRRRNRSGKGSEDEIVDSPKDGGITHIQTKLDIFNAPMATTTSQRYLRPSVTLNWDTIQQDLFWHVDKEFFFVNNHVCPMHNVFLTEHSSPEKCINLRGATAYAISCMNGVDIIGAVLSGAVAQYNPSRKPCPAGDHTWFETNVRTMLFADLFFNIPIRDECDKCHASIELTKLPKWLDDDLEEGELDNLYGEDVITC